jgi:hypothetical protein
MDEQITVKPEVNIDLSSIANTDNTDMADIQQNMAATQQNMAVNQMENSVPIVKEPENTIERRRLILIIQRYILEFEKYLGDLATINYSMMSEEELGELLKEIKFTVSVRNSGKMSEKMVLASIMQLEQFCCTYTPLKVQGLAQMTINDNDFRDTVKEFTLENLDLFYVSPSYRMIYTLLLTGMNLHVYNSQLEKTKLANLKTVEMTDKLKELDNEFNNI